MRISNLVTLKRAARKGRHVIWEAYNAVYRRLRRPVPGEFQPYYFTRPDRYPWLFGFAARQLGTRPSLRILSFGCSRGEEALSLRQYFPGAAIKGIDINPRNVARCVARAQAENAVNLEFEVAATTHGEATESYDAIFCLAVLCNGDLTTSNAQHCAPLLHFERFEQIIGDFARCLKPGGLLLLHTTNFRFCDTTVAADFTVVYEAAPEHLALDVLFDRNNRLMSGERQRYRAVGFQKGCAPGRAAEPVVQGRQ
jgi:2-polyprenyl-3-methyl-5-hydroxy-6-metoxy-1,4-benzoquinol methylase